MPSTPNWHYMVPMTDFKKLSRFITYSFKHLKKLHNFHMIKLKADVKSRSVPLGSKTEHVKIRIRHVK